MIGRITLMTLCCIFFPIAVVGLVASIGFLVMMVYAGVDQAMRNLK